MTTTEIRVRELARIYGETAGFFVLIGDEIESEHDTLFRAVQRMEMLTSSGFGNLTIRSIL